MKSEAEAAFEIALKALNSIAMNSCCTPCQEARMVADRALRMIQTVLENRVSGEPLGVRILG